MRYGWPRLLCAAALAGLAACGASTSTPTTPSAPATKTDSFSGTVAQASSDTHVFAVAASGSVQISLTAVAPLTTMSLGVAVTTSDGSNCLADISHNTDARTGTVALQGTATTGNYCVRVYDSGNVPSGATVDYTVQVLHP